jgi:hypothetical protein
MYTDKMTADCLGITVEQYRATYCGVAGRAQNTLAIRAVRCALAGHSDAARAALKMRDKIIAKSKATERDEK